MDLGQKNTVSDNVHQAICDVVGDMEVRVGRRMMRAISRMLSSFFVLIMIAEALQSRMMVTNTGWLQRKTLLTLNPCMHTCMYSFQICKAFGVIFVGKILQLRWTNVRCVPHTSFSRNFHACLCICLIHGDNLGYTVLQHFRPGGMGHRNA